VRRLNHLAMPIVDTTAVVVNMGASSERSGGSRGAPRDPS
jgi:hypothetical protein